MFSSEASCREFLATQDPSIIANQIRRDQELCKAQKLPSILARFLPSAGSELADQIALELCPETAAYGKSITRAQYSGVVQGIKAYLYQMQPFSRHEELPNTLLKDQSPSLDEIQTTLGVLDFFLKKENVKAVNLRTPLEDLLLVLKHQIEPCWSNDDEEQVSELGINSVSIPKRQKKCYICQFILNIHHPQYPSLCKQCGEFNLASSNLSLPKNLQLENRTALVTGGRLNLGYHTALRLLRCGAKVIVSTRYPRDAETRYLAEKDSTLWSDSLRIIGADFRSAKDVFHLVAVVKDQLARWSDSGVAKLDILINNAAQTLTDPLEKENQAVQNEISLIAGADFESSLQLGSSDYEARIRGGVQSSRLLAFESDQKSRLVEAASTSPSTGISVTELLKNLPDSSLAIRYDESKSSWMQSLHEIPYEDVISAHSVNTFVPLILLREFLPVMGALRSPKVSSAPSTQKPTKPLGYIINVSSREGIFESIPNSYSKNGHHAHTNLTKAALNMLTETEAGPAWKSRRIAINSVDPGYMSAAPEIEARWEGGKECPIGWEDGAGRVLWPIAVGERCEGLVWGRFLKHFGSVEVDVGVGR